MNADLGRIDQLLRELRSAEVDLASKMTLAAAKCRNARERLIRGEFLDRDDLATVLDGTGAYAGKLREASVIACKLGEAVERANDVAINENFSRSYATVN